MSNTGTVSRWSPNTIRCSTNDPRWSSRLSSCAKRLSSSLRSNAWRNTCLSCGGKPTSLGPVASLSSTVPLVCSGPRKTISSHFARCSSSTIPMNSHCWVPRVSPRTSIASKHWTSKTSRWSPSWIRRLFDTRRA